MKCPNHEPYENPQLQVHEVRRLRGRNIVEWKCGACWAWWSERVVPLARVIGHWFRMTVSAADLPPKCQAVTFGNPMWMYGIRCYEPTPKRSKERQ